MSTNFLHGVETVDVERGARTIRQVKSAVIGLIGTAPLFDVSQSNQKINEPVLVLSDRDAGHYFGLQNRKGFTIPEALDAIFDQGAGTVIVVNVFDPDVHKTTVDTAESRTFKADQINLGHNGITNLVVKDSTGAITYVVTEDYTLDAADGIIHRTADSDIEAGATVKVTYVYCDPTKVTAEDIIGEVDQEGNRTGMQALLDTFHLYGFWPKILIAPIYCEDATVAAELMVMAEKLRAVYFLDAPSVATPAEAIAGRGGADPVAIFGISSDRAGLLYPYLLDGDVEKPYSEFAAGVMADTDRKYGYWYSFSNKEIKGVTGTTRKLSAMINDSSSEVNALNEAGIITVFNSFGTGLRTWGNRSAAYPSVTHPRNFLAVRRTADMIHESVEFSMLQFMDQPITRALIDAICASVNGFIRSLISRGALIDGKCIWDPAKNSKEEIANGHLTFDISMMPPTPAERMTFESFIDVSLLQALYGGGR